MYAIRSYYACFVEVDVGIVQLAEHESVGAVAVGNFAKLGEMLHGDRRVDVGVVAVAALRQFHRRHAIRESFDDEVPLERKTIARTGAQREIDRARIEVVVEDIDDQDILHANAFRAARIRICRCDFEFEFLGKLRILSDLV